LKIFLWRCIGGEAKLKDEQGWPIALALQPNNRINRKIDGISRALRLRTAPPASTHVPTTSSSAAVIVTTRGRQYSTVDSQFRRDPVRKPLTHKAVPRGGRAEPSPRAPRSYHSWTGLAFIDHRYNKKKVKLMSKKKNVHIIFFFI
jgi:hypothetical protein